MRYLCWISGVIILLDQLLYLSCNLYFCSWQTTVKCLVLLWFLRWRRLIEDMHYIFTVNYSAVIETVPLVWLLYLNFSAASCPLLRALEQTDGAISPKFKATAYVQIIQPFLFILFPPVRSWRGHCPVCRLSGTWRGGAVGFMPKEADGVSPKGLNCCLVIMWRLRIAQALGEEMSPEQQRQQ